MTRVLDETGVKRNALGQVIGGKLNASGRPKGDAWFRKLCRKRTIKALKALEAALDRPDHSVSAAKALLEFGWGKAPAVVTLPEDRDDREPTPEEAAAAAKELRELGLQ